VGGGDAAAAIGGVKAEGGEVPVGMVVVVVGGGVAGGGVVAATGAGVSSAIAVAFLTTNTWRKVSQ
jgi:hypothetical protein